ncbi:MAG: amino acid permease [Chloracidobacterium sp.]|nr:amino acid permease [Chloracidobacterium sp.]MCC6825042.1 amino acid permease [Acidobacteriota bacterium]MCO5334143.1 amino acid permease [Pyrinomonadaceae bacterium]
MSNSIFRKKSIAQIQADAAAGFSDSETLVPGQPAEDSVTGLRRSLNTFDLTMLGIAAIIGAGIFAMVGQASFNGGPGVILLFIFAAIACGFAALCYAEFASKIPIAGSAYTYAYASFGELLAWIIGWDLLVEYAIGNIAVAISWSDYFTGLLARINAPSIGFPNGINIPLHFTMDFRTAHQGFDAVSKVIADGSTLESLRTACDAADAAVNCGQIEAYTAYSTAPHLFGIPVIADLPALGIVFVITALVYIGIRESKTASNIMVALKLAIIMLVIILGAFYVNAENWNPFLPNGFKGVMTGVAAVFFAYIGFDALSTTAEECKDPYKTLPRGMILSLIICTVLYVLLALVLTGMVSYKKLNVGDPLAFVFGPEGVNIAWVSGIIAVSAVIALATVLLVFQLGQPRLWMAMSRDGLLPKIFSSIHPKFRTPWFSTILTGIVVAIPALFMNLSEVTELSVIGTLFAFTIVCAGVLVKDKEFTGQKRFVPYINSMLIGPAVFLIIWGLLLAYNGEAVRNFFVDYTPSAEDIKNGYETTTRVFLERIPYFGFMIFSAIMAVLCFVKRLSLIPVLGIMCCTYLMTELGWTNWFRFGVWLIVGLVVYFLYSRRHSKLNFQKEESAA